jgi:outer membrane protein TolC
MANHPAVRAAEARARTEDARGASRSSLPPPEVTADLWQVPLSRPYAVGDAGMLMFGVRQTFPAPGALSAREKAGQAGAALERQNGTVALELVARAVRHAFADYLGASLRERAHASHRSQAERLVEGARARLAATGSLADLASARFEVERVEASRTSDAALADSARGRLNALLGRRPNEPLPPAEDEGAKTSALSLEELTLRGRRRRAELKALAGRTRVLEAEREVAGSEAALPMVTVSALYFAPVGPMTEHSYGASAMVSLPWLWGAARAEKQAAVQAVVASERDVDETLRRIDSEVADAHATLKGVEARYVALNERLVPAARRRLDAVLAGYVAGGSNLLDVVDAEQTVTMAELDAIDARVALDHALAELDWASGGPVPRKTLALSNEGKP